MNANMCSCDYEPASVYVARTLRARIPHRCEECNRTIRPGEDYERVFGVWDGHLNTFHTCPHCVALRTYMQNHVPCFCWAHGHTVEDVLDTLEEYAHEAPGLWFGAARLLVKTRQAKYVG